MHHESSFTCSHCKKEVTVIQCHICEKIIPKSECVIFDDCYYCHECDVQTDLSEDLWYNKETEFMSQVYSWKDVKNLYIESLEK